MNNSEGGDNLNLMFKVLKRGAKLTDAIVNEQFDSLADIGLRYDLTVPLTRYYAKNKSKLLFPMKCIQIGKGNSKVSPLSRTVRVFNPIHLSIPLIDQIAPFALGIDSG